jgi:hypothetical protein
MKAKSFFLMFAVLVMVASFTIAADTKADEYPWSGGLTPYASYSQLLQWGYVREVSAVEGGGPEKITLHYGVIYGPIKNDEPLRVEIINGVHSDTLDLGNADTETWWFARFLSSDKFGKRIMVGYDPTAKSIGFRTTLEGQIVKVEDERSLLFFTRDYNFVKVVSADQMYNDRSVAYRSFFGSHEGLRAKLDVIYFPLSNMAVLLAPAEYIKQYPSSGTVVRGQ